MFTTILVPLDGSTRAEHALPLAARTARASGARILLLRAVPVPITSGLMYEGESLRWRLIPDETEVARAYLSEVARSSPLAGISVDTVVAVGEAAHVILDASARRGADLVVMTSHGRTGVGRWMLGSVAEHVAHHSPVPILVLRERKGMGAGAGVLSLGRTEAEHRLRVLVPLDGSPLAEAALVPACALALALAGSGQASLHLTLVVAPYKTNRTNMPEALVVDGAMGYLERVSQRLRSEHPEGRLAVTRSVAADSDIAHGILAEAESGEQQDGKGARAFGRCDLIAMATHGHSGLARWALGSVTERVLHATKLPILIVRPQEMAARIGGADMAGPADPEGRP